MSVPLEVSDDEARDLLDRKAEIEFLSGEVGAGTDALDEELAVIDDALDAARKQAKAAGREPSWLVDS